MDCIHLDRLDEALVNKLVPCVWLSSGTLEVWGLEKNYTQMGIWPLTSWLSVDYRIQHQTIGHPMGTHTPHTHTPHTHTRQPLHSNKICDIYNKPFEVSLGILYLMCRDPNYRWSILYCGTRTLENLLHRKLNTSNAIWCQRYLSCKVTIPNLYESKDISPINVQKWIEGEYRGAQWYPRSSVSLSSSLPLMVS